ncbi:MAG: hypothetical protein ABEI77_01175 [Halorientalis sp.]
MTRRDERAVSDVIGFMLVFGLVATTVAIISVSGLNTLQHTRNAEQINNAERAFDVLADNMADIYRSGAPHRATEISLENAQLNTATTVKMNVSGIDSGGNRHTISDVQAQPIVWESSQDSTQIAYSLGGIVRASRQGGVMVHAPPFVFDDHRMLLLIPKTQTNTPKSLGGATIRVRGNKARSAGQVLTERLDTYQSLQINVTSPRAGVWKRYFEAKAVTQSCSIDHATGRKRVSCTLDVPDQLYVTVSGIDMGLEK